MQYMKKCMFPNDCRPSDISLLLAFSKQEHMKTFIDKQYFFCPDFRKKKSKFTGSKVLSITIVGKTALIIFLVFAILR